MIVWAKVCYPPEWAMINPKIFQKNLNQDKPKKRKKKRLLEEFKGTLSK